MKREEMSLKSRILHGPASCSHPQIEWMNSFEPGLMFDVTSDRRRYFSTMPKPRLEGLMKRAGLVAEDVLVLRSRLKKDKSTLKEVGKRLGVIAERVRQREERALQRLNEQVVREQRSG